MNYEQMSDFEINKAVAIAVGHKCYYDNGSYTNDGKHVVVKGNGVLGWFDPCNNWSDIGPIIEKYKIALVEPDEPNENLWGAGKVYCAGPWAQDSNPKRAAAICFLMMERTHG